MKNIKKRVASAARYMVEHAATPSLHIHIYDGNDVKSTVNSKSLDTKEPIIVKAIFFTLSTVLALGTVLYTICAFALTLLSFVFKATEPSNEDEGEIAYISGGGYGWTDMYGNKVTFFSSRQTRAPE